MSLEKTGIWWETLDAEIATIGVAPNAKDIRRLSQLYESLGLEKESLGVFEKGAAQKANFHELLPDLVDILLRRNLLLDLTRAVNAIGTIRRPEMTPGIRRALAKALSAFGQPEVAVKEWNLLIADDMMDEASWLHLALFLAKHGAQPQLTKTLERFVNASSRRRHPDPVLLFCLARNRMDAQPGNAREALRQIVPNRIGEPRLLLNLGVMAFRLGEHGIAEQALTALSESGGVDSPRLVENLLGSVRSFQGDASRLIRSLHVSSNVLRIIEETGRDAKEETYAWGYISEDPGGGACARLLPWAEAAQRMMDIPQGARCLFTFSVLPAGKTADPCEVLAYLDWRAPHLMMQRSSWRRIHAFVSVPGALEWGWEEARVESRQAPGRAELVETAGAAGAAATNGDAPSFWGCVSGELNVREDITS